MSRKIPPRTQSGDAGGTTPRSTPGSSGIRTPGGLKSRLTFDHPTPSPRGAPGWEGVTVGLLSPDPNFPPMNFPVQPDSEIQRARAGAGAGRGEPLTSPPRSGFGVPAQRRAARTAPRLLREPERFMVRCPRRRVRTAAAGAALSRRRALWPSAADLRLRGPHPAQPIRPAQPIPRDIYIP